MQVRWILILAAALVATTAEFARAGAWLQSPGSVYLKLSGVYSSTDERVDGKGDSAEADPFGGNWQEQKLFLYGEWGLVPRLTLVSAFSWGQQEIVNARVPGYGTRSMGDLRTGARWGLRMDPRFPVSVEGVLSVPTYPATDPSLPVGQREQFLPAGSGQVEAELRLQAGASFWPLPFYGNIDLGFRSRGGRFGDQWLLSGELGGSTDRLFGKIELRGIRAVGDPAVSLSAGAVSIEEDILRLAPEAAIRVGGTWWLGLGYSVLLEGRNTLVNDQWQLSLAWSRSQDPR